MPEDLGRVAQQIALVLDPDGPDPDDQQALQRRGLTIGRLHQGLHRITGHLLPDAAAQLQAVLDAMLNPKVDGPPHPTGVRFAPSPGEDGNTSSGVGRDIAVDPAAVDPAAVDPAGVESARDEPAGPDRVPVPVEGWNADPRAVIDPRTPTQKRHDAFAAAVGIAARHQDMPSLGGAAPTLVVTVDATDLAAHTGRARLPGSDATIPTTAAVHTACSGVIQRVLIDQGRIVGITVTDRVFTVHQRRAIIARDSECLIPGCHVPAAWCEIHHVTEHARGGPTSTDNGVPLCWWHHRSLATSGWEIRMNGGVPQVRGPAWWDPTHHWHTPTHTTRSLKRERIGREPRAAQTQTQPQPQTQTQPQAPTPQPLSIRTGRSLTGVDDGWPRTG
ncbi:HNH endonuclease [Microbacterium sp. LWO14-1.2]